MKLQRIFSDLQHADAFPAAAADYLFQELSRGETFVLSRASRELAEAFQQDLQHKGSFEKFQQSLALLTDQPVQGFRLVQEWVEAYLQDTNQADQENLLTEAALWLIYEDTGHFKEIGGDTRVSIGQLQGDHPKLRQGKYQLDYPVFIAELEAYQRKVVPQFRQFHQLKRKRIEQYRKQLRLESFQPKVMSAFVRNRLIDKVYLPLIGDNLAKQLGTAGAQTRTDRMGLLLLLSPPGYGKTTLMEYIANRLGLIFMKIDGPTIGHRVCALDPADAPNRAARQELEKLNLAFEMGDNIMIYIDDIQHCHPEFLQKFISLCDAQRKIEGVWKGEAQTYDFRSRRVAVVMAGNPYTESGERFRVPDMLANRADIYNLGDIIGDEGEAFKLSYIENALTSNPLTARLAGKSMADVYALIEQLTQTDKKQLELHANHSGEEIKEYQSVLEKMLRVREVILLVNRAYIQSAAIAEADRTEPPFRLQGSYRNMNKLTEKIVPIMNERELKTLILSHYEGELQTLTSGAEANRLKLRELMGILTEAEAVRWAGIRHNFRPEARPS